MALEKVKKTLQTSEKDKVDKLTQKEKDKQRQDQKKSERQNQRRQEKAE